MDVADHVPGAGHRLEALLARAREANDAPVEVLALDGLSRLAATSGAIAMALELCETADRRMEHASHFITELDRTDARWVRPDA
jgi:hypothetical protein